MKQGLSEKNKSHHFPKNNTLTHSQRPALDVDFSGRLVKLTTDLHPCCLHKLLQSRHIPCLTVELQTARGMGREGTWTIGGVGGIANCEKERGRRVNEHGRKERGEGGHKGSPGHSQSALCKQASSWSGQVAGGSHPRATGTVSRADNWWQECGICS